MGNRVTKPGRLASFPPCLGTSLRLPLRISDGRIKSGSKNSERTFVCWDKIKEKS